jgi:TPR repeat protein
VFDMPHAHRTNIGRTAPRRMVGAARARLSSLVIAALIGLGPTPAAADLAAELEDAQKALAAGDYKTAFREYSRFADENNNPLAQFTLSLFYDLGWGRPVDRPAACRWQEKAAEGRIPAGQHLFAECLRDGVNGPPEPAAAAQWYERAARNGHVISLCSLAELYIAGEGVPKDPAKGLELCGQVAAGDSVPAKIRMGRFHLEGAGGLEDPERAHGWFESAAQYGSAEALYYLGVMNRDGLGRPKAPRLAREWFEIAAGEGYRRAYLPTGELYFNGPKDPETGLLPAHDLAKAYLWLSAAARKATDPEELAQAAEMLERIREVMPETWVPDLDAKVAAHLAEHDAPKTTTLDDQ